MGIISGFIDGLKRPSLHQLGNLAQRQWRQAREASAYANFQPGEVGPGAIFPVVPTAESAPEAVRTAVLTDAEEILRGKFCVCGGLQLSVHTPPVWYRDYLAGQEAPTVARSNQLDPEQRPGRMDARLLWELNRWNQLVRLAQAFHLTRDDHFRESVVEWLGNWHQHNPVGVGWNWTRVTEAAVRLLNLTWIDALCSLPEGLLGQLLPAHVWWVHRYGEVGCGPEENPLPALTGLICATARWPQAEAWSRLLSTLTMELDAEIHAQFDTSGHHVSRASSFHFMAWQLSTQAQRALATRGINFSAATIHRLNLAASVVMAQPGQEAWDRGDSNAGSLTPFENHQSSARAEWQAWLLGETNALSYWLGAAPAIVNHAQPTHCFKKDDWQLCCYFGELTATDHSHLDALHCSIWQDGLAVMIDPGSYASEPAQRSRLAGPTAHNGPHFLDSALYPQRMGTCGWTSSKMLVQCHGQTVTLQLQGKMLQRTLGELERGWRFTDEATAPFAVHWQLAPGWDVEPHDDYLLLFRAGHSLRLQISGATVSTVRETCSPSYGQTAEAPMIIARTLNGGKIITELMVERLL